MKTLTQLAPAYIKSIAPYVPGKPISELERELGLQRIIKLASNENPLGASPKAIEAVKRAVGELFLYPDGNGFELKLALTRQFPIEPHQIILGNGSNDVLELAARAFLGPGTSAVYSRHAFAVYPLVTQATGALGIEVPAVNFGHDLEAMLSAIRPDTRLLFLANPNNPTGTFISGDRILNFLEKVPEHVLTVLDEAYTEYLASDDQYDAVNWLSDHPNLLICRTFSKAYGLAGLRVGYGFAHSEIINLLNRVRQPFNVNALGLVAATAALEDIEFLEKTRQVNRMGMAQLEAGFSQLGLPSIPSKGNFISVRVGDAQALYGKLLAKGVIVRPVANYQLPEYLRVTVGLSDDNRFFLDALRTLIEDHGR